MRRRQRLTASTMLLPLAPALLLAACAMLRPLLGAGLPLACEALLPLVLPGAGVIGHVCEELAAGLLDAMPSSPGGGVGMSPPPCRRYVPLRAPGGAVVGDVCPEHREAAERAVARLVVAPDAGAR